MVRAAEIRAAEIGALAGLVCASAAAAALAPLWTYALTLALFGLPHVLSELRYIDARFGARLVGRFGTQVAVLLAAIVLLRCAAWAQLGSADLRCALELVLGAGLVLTLAPMLRGSSPLVRTSVAAVALIGIAAASLAPLEALVWFALLHNLTPIGFFAERLRGAPRRLALWTCALVFGLVPLWIAGGGVGALLGALGATATDSGPAALGGLRANLGALVPPNLVLTEAAPGLFAAVAYLQCMHYVAVLWVLPRLGAGDAQAGPSRPWGARPLTYGPLQLAWCAALALPLAFAVDFGATRLVYGAFAAVHAWVEVPVLLSVCAAAAQVVPTRTTP